MAPSAPSTVLLDMPCPTAIPPAFLGSGADESELFARSIEVLDDQLPLPEPDSQGQPTFSGITALGQGKTVAVAGAPNEVVLLATKVAPDDTQQPTS
eukprot:1754739-Prymnesium_polylepis.1